jgi:hypothetical protein
MIQRVDVITDATLETNVWLVIVRERQQQNDVKLDSWRSRNSLASGGTM